MNRMKQAQRMKKKLQRKRQIRKRLILAASFCLCIELFVLGSLIYQEHHTSKQETSTPISEKTVSNLHMEKHQVKEPEEVSITISSTGDCTLGTDENFNYSTSLNAYYESHGADYFLQNVRDIFENDDLTIVNMEGTFTNETTRADKTFAFKASPDYVKICRKLV